MRRYYPPGATSYDEAIDLAFEECDETISGQYPHHASHDELIMWEQVGWALSRWGQVEIGLAEIFQAASGGKPALSVTIDFWGNHNIAGRIKTVKGAVITWSNKQHPEIQVLSKEIMNWLAKITMALNCARNELAHGTVAQKQGSNQFHLVPFFFKQLIERDREKIFREPAHGRDLTELIMLRKQFLGFSGLLADMASNIREIDTGRANGILDLQILKKKCPLFISQHADLFDRLVSRPFNQGDSLSANEEDQIRGLMRKVI